MLQSKGCAAVGPHSRTENWGPEKAERETAQLQFRGHKSYTGVKICGTDMGKKLLSGKCDKKGEIAPVIWVACVGKKDVLWLCT